ncbi:MAG: SLC13 family permease [Caulobacteraceae bacterium]|nr:SLC13 family permease [Caulobacter sp.]
MTLQQALAFAILGGAIVMFAWGRFRYDLIALCALLVGVLAGLVKPKEAFTGFTSDVVVIIATALIVSAAIAKSGIVELVARPLLSRLKTPALQVPALAGATALLSIPTKNVGALAILMPIALQLARKTETAASSLLMPMSFMSLLGGLTTLVGTSTNIIVSQVRQETLGKPFNLFDFSAVGLPLTGLGLIVVSLLWRVLPRREGRAGMGDAIAATAPYSAEAVVKDDLPEAVKTISDLRLGDEGVDVTALIGADGQPQTPHAEAELHPGDRLLLQGEQEALDRIIASKPLRPGSSDREAEKSDAMEEMRSVEVVVEPRSRLIGRSARRLRMLQEFNVNLLAVSREGARFTERLRDVQLRAGDVLVLQAGEKGLPDAMTKLGVLPLAERSVRIGKKPPRYLAAIVLAIAMTLVGLNVIPVAIGFFAAAVVTIALGGLSMREAYGSLEGEVLVLIGALTPLSEAVRHTGGTELIAHALSAGLHGVPPMLALGALLVTSMALSPFLHNAPTVLVLGPISVAVAQQLKLHPDAFLMAVAVGSGSDFLTPIGHQCNTLVMGPGGYKFGDYWKLGLPLSLIVIFVGTPLIALVWGLRAHG